MYACSLKIMLVVFLPISVSIALNFPCFTSLVRNFNAILNEGVYRVCFFSSLLISRGKTLNILHLSVILKVYVNILCQIKVVSCYYHFANIHWILLIAFILPLLKYMHIYLREREKH